MADKALIDGQSHWDFSGSIRRYLDAVRHNHGNCNNLRIHGGHLFLFADKTLVTAWALPNRYRKIADRAKKVVCGAKPASPNDPTGSSSISAGEGGQ